MKEITSLKAQSRNPDRVSVYLDGEFAFALAAVVAVGLKPGDHLSAEEIEKLRGEESIEAARRRALRLISRRPRSEHELRRYFHKREVSEAVQDRVLADLRASGLVDDEAFAHAWVENRMAFRPRSAYALRYELRQKGVSNEDIDAALENFDEGKAARQAARRAARRYKHLSYEEFRQRVAGYLGRRGFGYSLIPSVIEAVWRQVSEDESEANE